MNITTNSESNSGLMIAHVGAGTVAVDQLDAGLIENVLVKGDLANLSASERLAYYKAVCDSLGLNPLTRPFEYLTLQGRLVLYAKRECTEQLRRLHGISTKITAREVIDDVYVVTAQARQPDGRQDESTGAVPIAGLKGEAKANALMKAESKAKRRVTLSLCGLAFLDESELDTVPDAQLAIDGNPEPQTVGLHNMTPPAPADPPELAAVLAGMRDKSSIGETLHRLYDDLAARIGQESATDEFQALLKAHGCTVWEGLRTVRTARDFARALWGKLQTIEPVEEAEYESSDASHA